MTDGFALIVFMTLLKGGSLTRGGIPTLNSMALCINLALAAEKQPINKLTGEDYET